jgi:hypothetical protein
VVYPSCGEAVLVLGTGPKYCSGQVGVGREEHQWSGNIKEEECEDVEEEMNTYVASRAQDSDLIC